MAITNINNRYSVSVNEYAYTTTDHSVIKTGSSIPLYVPSLMPNIDSGSPKIKNQVTKGNMIFRNAPACQPKTKRILKSQNYISPPLSRNQSWDGIKKEKNKEEYIPRKSKVLCTSVTGTTKKLNFSTDYSG